MVVLALADLEFDLAAQMHQSGLVWLVKTQSVNGGWSGGDPTQPTSIEETALALSALSTGAHGRAVERAVDHLRLLTENGTHFPAAPVGFYFAKLWYWERLYPLVWTVEALEKVK
jgi:squalene-hopene/tetraprenyl-beta-curcumene cyclase